MNALTPMKQSHRQSPFVCKHLSEHGNITNPPPQGVKIASIKKTATRRRKLSLRASNGESEERTERRTFLSLEEAGLVEISGLGAHERFLCRLTISSLNLLRVIAEEEECGIEELSAGRICDWFLKDKLRREQNLESAVLQWDDSDLQF